MYLVVFTKQAAKDAKKLKQAGLEQKAKQLVEIVRLGPFQKPLTFEPLSGNLAGLCSRRINLQHRFVYQIIDEPVTVDGRSYNGTVKVVRMWTHYEQALIYNSQLASSYVTQHSRQSSLREAL